MSLPKSFSSNEEYFERCLQFFTKYEYLISHPNTHVLVHNVLDKIAIEYDVQIDLQAKSLNVLDIRNKSRFIDDFLKELEVISVDYDSSLEEKDNVADFDAPIGPKKKYEVVRLTEEVAKICQDYGCDTVVDIGSGLGYLDQRLHSVAGLNVLGIESNSDHVARAIQRQKQYYPNSEGKVIFTQMLVDEGSAEDIEKRLKDSFKSHGPVCMTGLHACGDLSVDGINIFLKMESVKSLILMPCCYHRMVHKENRFKNFPISSVLKRVSEKHRLIMAVPLLRMAAHPAFSHQRLGEMACSLLARAQLQLYAQNNNYVLKKNKRKPIKASSTFEEYINQLDKGYTLLPATGSAGERIPFDLDQLLNMWNSLPCHIFNQAAVYIQLQNWLQPVVENFVLYDRLTLLEESGVRFSRHRRLFRADTSPRCVATLAAKQ